MAKKKQIQQLHPSTIVTVVARLGDRVVVQDMSYDEALTLPHKITRSGSVTKWKYVFYEQGFTNIKSTPPKKVFLPPPPSV